jgi:hypothetical protein
MWPVPCLPESHDALGAGAGQAGELPGADAPENVSVETLRGLPFESDAVTIVGCNAPGDQVGHQPRAFAFHGGKVGDVRVQGVLAVIAGIAGRMLGRLRLSAGFRRR